MSVDDAPTDATADRSGSGSPPDYLAVAIPEDKEPTDYSYVERRAAILDRIAKAGSPRAINQTDLAAEYGVAQSTISKDVQILGDELAAELGDRIVLDTYAMYRRVVDDLLEQDKPKKAWDVQLDWIEFVGFEDVASEQEQARAGGSTGGLDIEALLK